MADNSSSSQQQSQSGIIGSIITSLQQGVVAINNVTKTLQSTFPSS
jgi:hypothetical protein